MLFPFHCDESYDAPKSAGDSEPRTYVVAGFFSDLYAVLRFSMGAKKKVRRYVNGKSVLRRVKPKPKQQDLTTKELSSALNNLLYSRIGWRG